MPVLAFTLHVSAEEHGRRIAYDQDEAGAATWRRNRRHDYDLARPWLEASTSLLDTTSMTPPEIVTAVIAEVNMIR